MLLIVCTVSSTVEHLSKTERLTCQARFYVTFMQEKETHTPASDRVDSSTRRRKRKREREKNSSHIVFVRVSCPPLFANDVREFDYSNDSFFWQPVAELFSSLAAHATVVNEKNKPVILSHSILFHKESNLTYLTCTIRSVEDEEQSRK